MGQSLNLANAHIITMNNNYPIAHSMCIQDGIIASLDVVNDSYQTIDCQGATVIPGFTDSHMHLTNLGKRMELLQLQGAVSAEDIAYLVKEKSATLPKGAWIQGFGWNQTLWNNPKFPTQEVLNNIIYNPVFLTRVDGHSAWVNNYALSLAGLSQDSCPSGGKIINNCVLIDNAMDPIKKIIPKDGFKNISRWIQKGAQHLVSKGITNVHDAWQDRKIISALSCLIDSHKIPLRCYGMLANDATLLDEFFQNGCVISDYYTIRAVKIFMDGALGSRGASLLEPYSDETINSGLILHSKEEFRTLAINCRNAGFQLCTHAIGDKTNRLVLDIYAEVLENIENHRWRIEHAQVIHDDDIHKFSKHNIIPVMQPSHCTSDMPWIESRLGKNRLHEVSRWQTLINSGVKIPGGSDCPIEDGNPLFEYYAAITRRDHDGHPVEGWQTHEKVSRLDALSMLTSWAAYGEFAEHRRGIIKLGYDADFTILSNDITQCEETEILSTEILYTIVGGKIVFSKSL